MALVREAVNSIELIHDLGGCGGTLLTQCLGSMQNVIVLSECNPLTANLFEGGLNPYVQLEKWHPDLFVTIKDEFSAKDLQDQKVFCHFVESVKFSAQKMGINVIIRDYNYIDYYGVPFLIKPAMNSSLMHSIGNTFNCRSVLLVRHPLYQYNSLRSHEIVRGMLSPDLFLSGYDTFLTDFAGCKIIKYEDIVSSPIEAISDLCHYFELPFSEDFTSKFYKNNAVTGNLNRMGDSQISLSKKAVLQDQWTNELQHRSEFQALVAVLGY
ncbi:MAG: hypothetical protein WAW86_01740 [Gammaproteobacteria bacterium]